MNDQDIADAEYLPVTAGQDAAAPVADAAPAGALEEPQLGGSYTRNPDTGGLDLTHRAGLDAEKE